VTFDIFIHHEGHEEHEVRSNNFPKPSCPSWSSWWRRFYS